MRVMFDTNVLISYFAFGSPTIARVVEDVALNHELLLSTFVIDEFRDVVARKWPDRALAAEQFLQRASFETVVTPLIMEEGLFDIRDECDYPVLYSAIIGFADVLVTGDKDFDAIALETPEIVKPAEYVERFARGAHCTGRPE